MTAPAREGAVMTAARGKLSARHAELSLDGDVPPVTDADPPESIALAEDDTRPTIAIRAKLTAMTDEAIAAIRLRPELDVFIRSRMVVSIARDGSARETWLHRVPGSPVIVPVDQAQMLSLMDRTANWVKWNGRKKANTPACPPAWIATQILARREWPFPYLEGVIETPTIRLDGSILDRPGYDKRTGLLYEPIPGSEIWPAIPARPTQEEAKAAAATLLVVVKDFPFVADSDKSAYLAVVLTLIARHLIAGPVPMFPIRAPTPGTGKGLLASVISIITTGREPAVMGWAEADELRKRITALAVAGTLLVLLDDLSGSVGSDVLARALTAQEWEDRLLGQTQMVRLPLKMVWLATGNNLGFQRTLGRRVVPIDLNAKGWENPEDRTDFEQKDLPGYVRAQRPALVVAALTILRGFIVAGRSKHGAARLGSFERWDDLIRSAVIWAGQEDPASANDPTKGRGRIRAMAEDDVEDIATLLRELQAVFKGADWTASELWAEREKDETLRAVIEATASSRRGPVTLKALRYRLRAITDRPARGLILSPAGRPQDHEARWKISTISAP